MGVLLHRIGDLVTTLKRYNPDEDYICKILNIKDSNDISHNEYKVVTGLGDKNSILTFQLEAFAVRKGPSSKSELSNSIEYLNSKILFEKKPNEIWLVNTSKELEKYENDLILIQERIKFFTKHQNRKDKLNDILYK